MPPLSMVGTATDASTTNRLMKKKKKPVWKQVRLPMPPPGSAHRSDKDYIRNPKHKGKRVQDDE